jgi:hypothetical protein
LLVGEWADFLAKDGDEADQFAIFKHRHGKQRAEAAEFDAGNRYRVAFQIGPVVAVIGDVQGPPALYEPAPRMKRTETIAMLLQKLGKSLRHAESRDHSHGAVLEPEHGTEIRLANTRGALQHGFEHRLQLAGRRTDDAQHIRRRGLLL